MKKNIENYPHKAKILKENGWVTYYNDDNWVKKCWFSDPRIRMEHAGLSTDIAYNEYDPIEIQRRELENLKIIEQHKKIKGLTSKQDKPFEVD